MRARAISGCVRHKIQIGESELSFDDEGGAWTVVSPDSPAAVYHSARGALHRALVEETAEWPEAVADLLCDAAAPG
jgi:hypothetical protein